MPSKLPHVISASRRTDLVAWYPDWFAEKILKISPEKIHTLVIWTKNPRNIFEHKKLNETLKKLDRIFVHLTVTGLGGTEIEPGVPLSDEIIPMLDDLVEFTGNPELIRWRFDPLLHWVEADVRQSNVDWFAKLAPLILKSGIKNVITSFCSFYPKVIDRFRSQGRSIPVELSGVEKENIRRLLNHIASECGFSLRWCCDAIGESSVCIDGNLLNKLHPHNRTALTEKASGQRDSCRCTRSWDIGWYSHVCRGGCLYCYGSPSKSAGEAFRK